MSITGSAPDLDAQFPALARWAKSKGQSLVSRGNKATPGKDRYLDFKVCCHLALADQRNDFPSPYSYLVTLDEFFNRFGSDTKACSSTWNRLTGGAESNFLDTIVETAWALHFLDNHIHFEMERRFDQADPASKNTDFLVTFGDKKFWLDAASVDFTNTNSVPKPRAGTARPTLDQAAAGFAERARGKYNEKFRTAVRSGLIAGDICGILLCTLMSEWTWPAFLEAFGQPFYQPQNPSWFPSKTPNLGLVDVHTLRCGINTRGLRPEVIFRWLTPEAVTFADAVLPPIQSPQLICK